MKLLDNLSLSQDALSLLEKNGVQLLVVCAGARNAPLVKSLDQFKNFEVLYFFDERAAGFFALGRSKASGRPAAVITTSGTAVAELLPAVIEARYSHLPIVVVTADRPKSFRGKGAPQSIEQVGIFSHYVENSNQADWDAHEQASFKISSSSPSHLNICFTEPLLSSVAAPDVNGVDTYSHVRRPIVVLGEIPKRERKRVEEFLVALKAPVYAEAHSGLKNSSALSPFMLKSGDRFLSTAHFQAEFDGIIRIGGVPTSRLWRDLEDKLVNWGVFSVCENSFSGLGRKSATAVSYQSFFSEHSNSILKQCPQAENRALINADRDNSDKLELLLKEHPTSEPAFVRRLSEQLGDEARVFVGNSLPIREWDLAALPKSFEVAGNRGVNGIDGLVSTFLGWAEHGSENVIVLGDLSALYDLSALWADAQKMTAPVKIVVLNNSGGHIFNRMFRDPRFLNSHRLEFSKWAEMFGLQYFKIDSTSNPRDWAKLRTVPVHSVVYELVPDNEATQAFWSGYEKLF